MPTTDLTPLLDPELRAPFAALPEIVDATDDPIGAKRFRDERFARLAAEGASSPAGAVDHEDVVIAGPDGTDLLVRVYGAEPDGSKPVIVWMHGGGFSGGSVRFEDPVCEFLAESAGAVVVSVEYRLLPDHAYPAAVDDTYAAATWVSRSGPRLGADVSRLALGGLSAGATLAAGTSLLIRDRGELAQAYQLLMYGSYDHRLVTPSSHRFQDPRSPNRTTATNTWRAYLGDLASDPPPYAVPMQAADLAGLPPAYVLAGAVELVRDENVAYAQRLLEAGVPTELHVYPGCFHGFDVLVPDAQVSRDAREDLAKALRRSLGRGR